MSSANEQHPHDTIASITSATLKPQEHSDLLAIENAIERMRNFTPTEPYVLTIPQDVEPRYHHYHAGPARQWLHSTPFDAREHEATQYQTFIYHEPGRDMYQLHVSRPVEEEGRESVRKAGGGTGANTPMDGKGPKKTISLSAYKKKVTGATPDASAVKEKEGDVAQKKAPAVKGPVERIKADEEVLAAVDDGEDVVKQTLLEETEKKDLKRKRGESSAGTQESSKQVENRESAAGDDEEAPAKKPRRISPPARASGREKSGKDTADQPEQAIHSDQKPKADTPNPPELGALPPKLSPPPPLSKTQEGSDKSKLIPSLPGRLSPTIPNNITSTLAARAHYRSASRSSDISVSGPRSASKDPASRHFTPPPKTVPRNAFRANSNSPAVRSDTEERGRAAKPAPSRPKTPEGDGDESDEITVSKTKKGTQQHSESTAEEAAPPSRLLVKFKFKKSQREAVRRILKMRPNPVKVSSIERSSAEGDEGTGRRASRSSEKSRSGRRDTNAKGVAQKVGLANGRTKDRSNTLSNSPERKRPRSEDTDDSDTAPVKRRKAAPDSIDVKNHKEPSTPAPSDLLSPSSAQKATSQQLTPSTMRKDVLSAAMKREHSTDSRLNTPPAMSQNSPTVNGTSQATVNGALRSERQPSNKTPKQQAWESEQKRLETLGRELKHAASDHLKSLSLTHSDAAAHEKEQKLAAIKSLESLLSYMLAFTCADEAALAADPKLQPSTKTWRSLHGFFGFVKRHCEAFPPLLGLACWLGVVFNARILELTPPASHPSLPPPESLLDTTAMMQRAANEADTKLDVDLLQSVFPKTWEGRWKGSLAPAGESLEVGKGFKGLYKLPIGLQTSPLRAARAGYAMLEEWIEKESGSGGESLYGLRLRL